MNINAHIALLSWIPLVFALFAVMPARRAVIAAFIGAWLFLPMAGYQIQGLPNYDKITATAYGVLLGIIAFDMQRILRFRPSIIDVPIVLWCVLAFVSSVVNGLGAYDGASSFFTRVMMWGVPYFVGRMYFSDLEGLKELAIGIFIGGLIYAPFCLWEIRMSPRLHNIIYGFHQHTFRQAFRFGGYRPMVFMQHGLAVALWMAGAALVGFWLWHTKAVRHIFNVPMSVLVGGLIGVTILCKSIGAILLLFGGIALLMMSKWMRTAVLAVLIIVAVPAYLGARAGLEWDGQGLVTMAQVLDQHRAESLETRLVNEHRLVGRAWQNPLFGWGSGGGFREVEDGGDVITDSLWIITFGQSGLVGLALLLTLFLLPVAMLLKRTRMRGWHHADLAAPAALAALLLIVMLDNLVNAMINPVYMLVAGGLLGLTMRPRKRWKGRRRRVARDEPLSAPSVQGLSARWSGARP